MVIAQVWKCIEELNKSRDEAELYRVEDAYIQVYGGGYEDCGGKPYDEITFSVTKNDPHCNPVWITFTDIEDARKVAQDVLKLCEEIKDLF